MEITKKREIENIRIKRGRIGFRNFSGNEGQYNQAGNRNFTVFLDDPDFAHKLEKEGWNIKWLKAREEGDSEQAMLQVKVAFGAYPPKVVLISDGKQTELKEEDLNMLDWMEIDYVDLVIRPYEYKVSGRSGIKAYAKALWVVLIVDEFEKEYSNGADFSVNFGSAE